MTDIKQFERNMQNIHAQNEHSSYCECIWCLETDTQHIRTSGEYIWQCMGISGKAYSFVDATRQALQSFIQVSL